MSYNRVYYIMMSEIIYSKTQTIYRHQLHISIYSDYRSKIHIRILNNINENIP